MKSEIIHKLLDINDQFYQSFGAAFAETRRRLQPGVQLIVDQWIKAGDWLDIGCGSGVLGQRLAQGGMQGSYLGLDFSAPLLSEAVAGAHALDPHPGFQLDYLQANLLENCWTEQAGDRIFEGVLAFAVLHHLPGSDIRARIFRQVFDLLKPGGVLIHSEWQFQNNPKLVARIQPWSTVGLSQAEVEPGDTLLDWRHFIDGQANHPGLRYVHLFTRAELADLGGSAGLTLLDEFSSDGVSGDLGLYQVWQKPA